MRIDAVINNAEYRHIWTASRQDETIKRVMSAQNDKNTAALIPEKERAAPASIVFWQRRADSPVLQSAYTGQSNYTVTAGSIPETERDISPAGDLHTQKKNGPDLNSYTENCKTCSERMYQDKSDDSGVSFQMAGHIGRNASASVVMGHEREHERREKKDAEENGMKVVATRVQVHMSQCPECHKLYASGGETRVLKTKDNSELFEQFDHLRGSRHPNRGSPDMSTQLNTIA